MRGQVSVPAETSEEEGLLRAEVERLGREGDVLDRQWRQKYRLALFALLAIPVYFVGGPFWAGITILMTPALVATQAYLLMVRRSEVRELLTEAKAGLAAHAAPRRSSVGARKRQAPQADATQEPGPGQD